MARRRASIAGVVLAAGMSTRFGANKLLSPLDGKPLLGWVLEAALASRLKRIVVVLGHQAERVRTELADLLDDGRAEAIINPRFAEGQSTSVVAGLEAVRGEFTAAMFLMGDQPLLDAGIIDRLIDAHGDGAMDICLPAVKGRRRNPVIFSRRFFPDILALSGDTGARAIIEAHGDAIARVAFEDERAFRDVDREDDMRALKEGGE